MGSNVHAPCNCQDGYNIKSWLASRAEYPDTHIEQELDGFHPADHVDHGPKVPHCREHLGS